MKTIAISGGFDPLHEGHINLIEHAARYGNIIIILNSDDWLIRKKGHYVMSWHSRARICAAMRNVAYVVRVNDDDNTVCEALRRIRPDYFANGGDRKLENTPELDVCRESGIKPLFGIGGDKQASSSEIIARVVNLPKPEGNILEQWELATNG